MLFLEYPTCSTCKKAKKWLDEHGVSYEDRHIRDQNPTVSELKAMEQRMDVAMLLDEGLIYSEILERTGASSATISRVNRCLHYGAGGYKAIIPRLKEEQE